MEAAAALIGALAALIGVLVQGAKTRAEVARIMHELQPNSGKSMRDQLNRVDVRVSELGKSIGGIRDDARADREALVALHRDMTATTSSITDRLNHIERIIE